MKNLYIIYNDSVQCVVSLSNSREIGDLLELLGHMETLA